MKVGDYVRTPYGIREVKDIRIKDNYLDDGFYVEDRFIVCGHKAMQKVKSSPNIIDLIEVGDYVNGKKVIEIWEESFGEFAGQIFTILDGEEAAPTIRDIKSIVTKEQFEEIKYEIK